MKVIIVGRDSDCDFIVNDVKVSRKHLQIIIDDESNYSVVDLGSMNGTFVNGNRIKGEIKLHRGDVIKIGNTELPWKDIVKRQDSDPLPKKPKKWIIYVFVVLVVVLLSVIVGIVVNNHRNSKELEKNKKYTELENKANKEYIDKLETLNEKNIKDKKEANTKAEKAEKAKNEAIEAQKAAENDIKEANTKAEKAEKAKNEAIEAQKAAENNTEEANKRTEEAEEKLKQTELFLDNFYKLNFKQYLEVADSLDYDYNKQKKDDAKNKIKNAFKEANNAEKKRINEVIENVLKKDNNSENNATIPNPQKSNEIKEEESCSASDSSKSNPNQPAQ